MTDTRTDASSTSTALVAAVAQLPAAQLEALGLAPSDHAAIVEIAAALDVNRRETLSSFGRDAGKKSAHHADSMLAQVRSGDMDAMGGKLTEVLGQAQSLNLHALGAKRSRIPLIGGLIDKVRQSKDELVNQFSSVSTNIERLMGEVTAMQAGLQGRINSLDDGFGAVKQEYRELGLHIAAGGLMHQQLKADVASGQAKLAAGQLSVLQSQELQDKIAAADMLDKRIADMRVLQQSALQTLPMIRLVQTNNSMLIEKFHTVKELTLPAWKRQFMLGLSLQEQRSAVQLAGSIDDATNAFLKENAQLLKQNTVATAQSNQRLVIDVATLQAVQDSLLSTVQEVIQINQEGMKQRAGVADQLAGMREQHKLQLGKSA